jgi:hypothetical protein
MRLFSDAISGIVSFSPLSARSLSKIAHIYNRLSGIIPTASDGLKAGKATAGPVFPKKRARRYPPGIRAFPDTYSYLRNGMSAGALKGSALRRSSRLLPRALRRGSAGHKSGATPLNVFLESSDMHGSTRSVVRYILPTSARCRTRLGTSRVDAGIFADCSLQSAPSRRVCTGLSHLREAIASRVYRPCNHLFCRQAGGLAYGNHHRTGKA